MRRCAIYVSANIVEGCKRQTTLDFCHFLNISEGSLEELKYYLLLSKDLSFVSENNYESLMNQCEEVGRMISGLIASLKRSKKLLTTIRCLPLTALLLTTYHLLLTTIYGESFKILGSRPLGMGGAYVAIAEDSLAQYWNPAGIAGQKWFDSQIPVNAKAEFSGGILKDANALGDIADKYSSIQNSQKNGTSLDAEKVSAFLKGVNTLDSLNKSGKGVLLDAHGGLDMRIARIAISVNNFTSISGSPFVDTTNIGLGANASASATGISYTGSNVSNPATTSQQQSRDKIKNALDQIGLAILNQVSNNAISNAGITNTSDFANALVNLSTASGLTDSQIADAATQIADSAATAKTVLEKSSSGNPYTNNQSNITLRGLSLTEIAVGYGFKVPFVDGLQLGANLKLIYGQTAFKKFKVLERNLSGNDFIKDFKDSIQNTLQPGVDLGLLLDKREKYRVKVGVVGRNLNYPKFDNAGAAKLATDLSGNRTEPDSITVEPQVRAGIAIYPFKRKFWVIASDVDVTNNKTLISGFSSRNWGAGTEINIVNSKLFNLAARVGLSKNLSDENSKLSYCGGIGLTLLHFVMDVSGSLSADKEQIKSGSITSSQEVPQNTQVAVTIGLNF